MDVKATSLWDRIKKTQSSNVVNGIEHCSLFQAPREKRAGEDEGTKTRGTGGEKKAGKKRSL